MMIVHKCSRCGHHDTASWSPGDRPDGAHVATDRYEWPRPKCRQGCTGCAKGCDWGPPVTVPTFTWPHELEDHVYPPGKAWSMDVITCGCMHCRGLYAEVSA